MKLTIILFFVTVIAAAAQTNKAYPEQDSATIAKQDAEAKQYILNRLRKDHARQAKEIELYAADSIRRANAPKKQPAKKPKGQ